jgi:excisionase family DNA binding protein
MTNQIVTEWLSLHQAAEVLGIHPATLRTWSDRGRTASRRTPGGHRRFSHADLTAWIESQRHHEPEAELLVQNALGRMRMEIER